MYKIKNPPWNEDLAYFFGLLLGDGSLPQARSIRPNGKIQERHIIHFVSNSECFIKEIYIPLFKKIFRIDLKLEQVKNKKNPLFCCRIESKEIYHFLEKIGFTTGKKAKIAKVPKIENKLKKFVLAGLLDTDGGKKGNGFGLSTASKNLANFFIEFLKEKKLEFTNCPWHYNNHCYHQIYIKGSIMHKLLNHVPIKNKQKIEFILSKMPS